MRYANDYNLLVSGLHGCRCDFCIWSFVILFSCAYGFRSFDFPTVWFGGRNLIQVKRHEMFILKDLNYFLRRMMSDRAQKMLRLRFSQQSINVCCRNGFYNTQEYSWHALKFVQSSLLAVCQTSRMLIYFPSVKRGPARRVTKCYVKGILSTTRAQACENCINNKVLAFKTKAICRRLRHFPISKVLKGRLNFRKVLGGVQSFWKLFCKRKVARKTTPPRNRIENQQC